MTHVLDRTPWSLIRRTVWDIGWMDNGPLVVGVGLFIVGIGLVVVGVGLFLGMPSLPTPSTSISDAIPSRPATPIVAPANTALILESTPMDFTMALPLGEEASSSPLQLGGAEQNAAWPNESVPLLAGDAEGEGRSDEERATALRAESSFSGLAMTYEDQLRRYRQLERKSGEEGGLELFGLVVDETMTRLGRDFYNQFYDLWQAPPTRAAYTIRIQERPVPGRSTMLQVLVNDDVTFRARLSPGREGVGDRPLQAARRTYAYIQSGRGTLEIF